MEEEVKGRGRFSIKVSGFLFLLCLGLPLTSSPAPLRRGLGKFDYDSAISSPHDIKKALFQSQYVEGSNKKLMEKEERKRRLSQKLLFGSEPVSAVI